MIQPLLELPRSFSAVVDKGDPDATVRFGKLVEVGPDDRVCLQAGEDIGREDKRPGEQGLHGLPHLVDEGSAGNGVRLDYRVAGVGVTPAYL